MTRYGLGALFLIAVLLSQAASFFWLRAEIPSSVTGESYENSDLYQYVYPAMNHGFGRLRTGELPLWNSRQLCGTPFLADHRVGLFQPLNAMFLWMPAGRAMAAQAFVSLFLMAFFFVLFARSMGVCHGPALFGALTYAFCGATAGVVSRPSIAAAMVWAPLLFMATREYARAFKVGWILVGGLAGALLILSGAYAVVFAFLVVYAPYRFILAAFPGRSEETPYMRRAGGLVFMGVLALLLSAVQWVPSLVHGIGLDRPSEFFWQMSKAVQVPSSFREAFAQLLMSRPGSLPRLCYIGTASLLVIPAAFFHRQRWRDVGYFAAASVVMCGVALLGPDRLPLGLPRVAMFHAGVFCIAVLAAIGADRLLTPRQDYRSPAVLPPALAVLLFAAVVFSISGSQTRGWIIAFVVFLAPFLFVRQRWFSIVTGFALGLLLFADLTVASVNDYRHPFQDAPECYRPYYESIQSAQENALGARVAISARELDFAMPSNLGMIYPLDVVGGGHLPLTSEQVEWWRRLEAENGGGAVVSGCGLSPDAKQPSLLNYMAAGVVLATPDSEIRAGVWGDEGPRLREAQSAGDARVYVNEQVLPRAYWAPGWRLADGVSHALEILGQADFDPARECVMASSDKEVVDEFWRAPVLPMPSPGDEPTTKTVSLRNTGVLEVVPGVDVGSSAAPTIAGAGNGGAISSSAGLTRHDASCTLRQVSPECVEIKVDAPQRGITVLSDTFQSGWRATLDGEPCPIVRVNGLFRGVPTPPGQHEIRFVYRPTSFVVGAGLTVFGVVLALVYGLTRALRKP